MSGFSSFPTSINSALERFDFFHPEEWEKSVDWQPFHPGVQIHRIYGDATAAAAASLLKFQPGASIPFHAHTGYEHILVLSGSQSDEQGTMQAGRFRVNAPGTGHSVVSKDGCIVLVIYEKAVDFGDSK